MLFKSPVNAAVYLVLDGCKMHVPNPSTYNNLFNSWDCVEENSLADAVCICPDGALSDGAILAVQNGGGAVYLVSNGEKRHITSPATFENFCFDWAKIASVVQAILLDSIPTGLPI